ncbi:putative alpha-glycosyltransferase/ family 4 [Synechococcus sp. BIOS-U3-1]|uniref:glycosyltransferase n=1 Tax=Synechococcus sp. BIOS-U3-1 TaxID=1400865 RepID=UPI001644F661|nr:glycosyltransferase [Synechococcus sp. BIOS-U3-1]QNI57130.1 putative alpha-glycosyltransferase/ family 4 [Synechococcus sp. BIOS-U3-1]
MLEVRVAFTIDSLKLGGAERVLLQWASWCRQEGWQVLIVTRQAPQSDAYPLPEGIERVVEPPLPRQLSWLGWFAFPFRVLALRQLLRLHRIDLAVGVTTLPAVKLLLATVGLSTRTVVSERNYPPAKPISLPWRWLRRLTYPLADLHLIQTRETGLWLRENCAVHRQQLLPNSVTWPLPDREPVLEPSEFIAPRQPLILAAGTKAHQKGFDRLMPVFAELGRCDPDLHLALLGLAPGQYHGFDQQRWLRQLLGQDSDLQERLLMPGVSGSMARWYTRATVFVLPSRYEGFPNVLLEAMAAGCACIASDCLTGPADLILHGENGLLLSSQATSDDWGAAIAGLLADPGQCLRLGERAARVRERYDAACLRNEFLEALLRLRHG